MAFTARSFIRDWFSVPSLFWLLRFERAVITFETDKLTIFFSLFFTPSDPHLSHKSNNHNQVRDLFSFIIVIICSVATNKVNLNRKINHVEKYDLPETCGIIGFDTTLVVIATQCSWGFLIDIENNNDDKIDTDTANDIITGITKSFRSIFSNSW